jgi:tetratricopeptide (TPR) repeat protein
MSARDATQLRVELARGHWQLGERAEAVACLERAAEAGAPADALLPLVIAGLDELDGAGEDELATRLASLRARLAPASAPPEPAPVPAPIATPTLARLLAEQGHAEKALAVADQVLRRNANDERALAVRAQLAGPGPATPSGAGNSRRIAELSRWLANLARRKQDKHGGALA